MRGAIIVNDSSFSHKGYSLLVNQTLSIASFIRGQEQGHKTCLCKTNMLLLSSCFFHCTKVGFFAWVPHLIVESSYSGTSDGRGAKTPIQSKAEPHFFTLVQCKNEHIIDCYSRHNIVSIQIEIIFLCL